MNTPCLVFRDDLDMAARSGCSEGLGAALLHNGSRNGEIDAVHLRLGRNNLRLPQRVLPLHWFLTDLSGEAAIERAVSLARTNAARNIAVGLINTNQAETTGVCALRTGEAITVLPCSPVETGPGSFSRNHAVLETHALSDKCVTVVGLGSGGSHVVDALARSGVGRFVMWDNDRLEPHNIGRHVLSIHDAGRRKVLAMRDHVLSINPSATVTTIDEDVMDHAGTGGLLARIAAESDVIVGATDSNPSRFAINEAAWRAGVPVLFGRAFKRACGGDVIQVIPGRNTPCYACHTEARVVDEEISSPRDMDRVAYSDTVVPIEPGLNLDIAPIATMLSRLALLRLCGEGSGLRQAAAELDAPLYLWANRREEQFAGWAPMRLSHDRLSVLRWYAIGVEKNPECAVCHCSR